MEMAFRDIFLFISRLLEFFSALIILLGGCETARATIWPFVTGRATPLAGLSGHPPEFRQQALRDLRGARQAGLLSASISAMQGVLAALRPGASAPLPPSISFSDLQKVVGFPDYWARETQYQVAE